MGVYLPNVDMPKGRPVCIVIDVAGQARRYDLNNDRYADDKLFEAVPVPPHGRLGDLDKLEQMFADIDHAPYSGFDGEDPFYSAADAAQIIRLAPTIIPAEEGEP